MERINTYEKWLEKEGLPVIRDYSIPDVMAVPLKPWARKGGLGVHIDLVGCEGNTEAYLCEIPPGKSLLPQKHLYEEIIYILSGYGATTVWVEGSAKQTFEWQEGSLFAPPLNAWHQHFNGQSDKPVKYLGVTRAPTFMNLFHDLDFIFNNDYVFRSRYGGEEDYFSSQGRVAQLLADGEFYIWESNLIPDCRSFKLEDNPNRPLSTVASLDMSNGLMSSHIMEAPAGVYMKGHYHVSGAHLLCLSGQGYDLLWPVDSGIMAEGVERMKINWQKNSLWVPPARWFHQHFSTGKEPARMLGFHSERSYKYKGIGKYYLGRESIKRGGTQIDHEDEDPAIRRLFKQELAKTGTPWGMSHISPGE